MPNRDDEKRNNSVIANARPQDVAALRAPIKSHPGATVGKRSGPGSPGFIPKKRRPAKSTGPSPGQVRMKQLDDKTKYDKMGWKRKQAYEQAGYDKDLADVRSKNRIVENNANISGRSGLQAQAENATAGQNALNRQNTANQAALGREATAGQNALNRGAAASLAGANNAAGANLAGINNTASAQRQGLRHGAIKEQQRSQFARDLTLAGSNDGNQVDPFGGIDYSGLRVPPPSTSDNLKYVKGSLRQSDNPMDGRGVVNLNSGEFQPLKMKETDQQRLIRLQKQNAADYSDYGN